MRIAILHASAGHGHQRIAEAIREGFLASGVSAEDVLILDALDETPFLFHALYKNTYYFSVKHLPRAWGAGYQLLDKPAIYRNVGSRVRRCVNSWVGKGLVRRLIREKPDVILFTHFMAPEILGHAKQRGDLSSLLVTVITDFFPHTFWVNPGTDYYWVMSEEGEKDLERRGVDREKVVAGGIPVALAFRPQGKKGAVRRKEGLDENRYTLLITSGSFGLGPTSEILEALRDFGDRIQVLVVCGHNEKQRQLLEKQTYPFHLRLFGFVSHMPDLMEASDLVVAKPGGSTTTETLAKGVPMAVVEPIPGQEMGNARLLKERNAAFFLGKPSDIRIILKAIFDYPEVLEDKKRIIRELANPEAAVDLAKFVLEKIGAGHESRSS